MRPAAAEASLFGQRKSCWQPGSSFGFRKSVAIPNCVLSQVAADENDVLLVRGWKTHGSYEEPKHCCHLCARYAHFRMGLQWITSGDLFDADNIGR